MLKTVKPYLDAYLETLSNGYQLACDQEQEKFPNGFDYPESTYSFDQLVQAIKNDHQLINTGKPSDVMLAVLAAFRADFKPGVVKTGRHLNLNDFVKAYAIHDKKAYGWTGDQLAFFSEYVIGFLERLLPAPYMQRFCQGLLNQDRPFKRSYEVMNYATNPPKKITMLPLDTVPGCRLGKGFVVDGYRNAAGLASTLIIGIESDVRKLCQVCTAELSRLSHTCTGQHNVCRFMK